MADFRPRRKEKILEAAGSHRHGCRGADS